MNYELLYILLFMNYQIYACTQFTDGLYDIEWIEMVVIVP